MAVVTVVRVFTDQNMRGIHGMREQLSKNLSGTRVALAINKAMTIARVITAAGDVLSCYAYEGEVFDIAEIQRRVKMLSFTLTIRAVEAGKFEKAAA